MLDLLEFMYHLMTLSENRKININSDGLNGVLFTSSAILMALSCSLFIIYLILE